MSKGKNEEGIKIVELLFLLHVFLVACCEASAQPG